MNNNSLFEISDVGFITALKWLIYKVQQQFLEDRIALACKLLCPAICVIILGIIRGFFEPSSSFTYYPNYTNTNDVTPINIQQKIGLIMQFVIMNWIMIHINKFRIHGILE